MYEFNCCSVEMKYFNSKIFTITLVLLSFEYDYSLFHFTVLPPPFIFISTLLFLLSFISMASHLLFLFKVISLLLCFLVVAILCG